VPVSERRAAERVGASDTPWHSTAVLRPGQDVELINLSPIGALIASPTRMKPGGRAELQLLGPARRLVRGRIERCRVTRLYPMRYEGVIVFEEPLDWTRGR
jgi:hypothetical protein